MDIVENRSMNSTSTNVGGWPATSLRTYANGDFLNKLPAELRKVIIDTKVISGHGSSDKNANRTDGNWESTDKIYLLSGKEVWDFNECDTAYDKTRQLDYYKKLGVTTSIYSGAIKNYYGSASYWWLRGAHSSNDYTFLAVDSAGSWNGYGARSANGFAPAFRIR